MNSVLLEQFIVSGVVCLGCAVVLNHFVCVVVTQTLRRHLPQVRMGVNSVRLLGGLLLLLLLAVSGLLLL